jgi:hypothetical protein
MKPHGKLAAAYLVLIWSVVMLCVAVVFFGCSV